MSYSSSSSSTSSVKSKLKRRLERHDESTDDSTPPHKLQLLSLLDFPPYKRLKSGYTCRTTMRFQHADHGPVRESESVFHSRLLPLDGYSDGYAPSALKVTTSILLTRVFTLIPIPFTLLEADDLASGHLAYTGMKCVDARMSPERTTLTEIKVNVLYAARLLFLIHRLMNAHRKRRSQTKSLLTKLDVSADSFNTIVNYL